VVYLPVDKDVQLARIAHRQETTPHQTFPRSEAWLAAVTTAALVPMVAALLLGGGVADRHRRDTVLCLTSLGAGLTQAGVAAIWARAPRSRSAGHGLTPTSVQSSDTASCPP
jgi:hypothetical protein